MVKTETPVCDFGHLAPDFELRGTDGRRWRLADCRGERGTLVMFICNHCPYVKAIRERLVRDTTELLAHGVRSVAIMSNDPTDYPEDSFENMGRVAAEYAFPFPYLLDEDQSVAKAYGAVCTPDFFGYDADLGLQYRGRLDASGLDSCAIARHPKPRASCSMPCAGSPPERAVPPSRSRVSGVPSNGAIRPEIGGEHRPRRPACRGAVDVTGSRSSVDPLSPCFR
jgi:peroxiredoxin